MERGGSRTRTTDGEVIRTGDGTGETTESASSSTRTANRMVIRMGAAPRLPVAPSRKRTLGGGGRPGEDVTFKTLLVDSKHRDGSVLTESSMWHKLYRMNITDETHLEPMMMSKKSKCKPYSRDCQMHLYCDMMQVYWLKLAYITVDSLDSPIQLYGYLAARDLLNPRRNYLFNRSRDDPYVVVQDDDWLIQMSGPKRGIEMTAPVLIEFDMRIKTGEKEEDLQLIDGAVNFSDMDPPINMAFTERLGGEGGAVDINLAHLYEAAEATIQVRISEACSGGLTLCLNASGSGLLEKARLFNGIVPEAPCDLDRFVFAVMSRTKLVVVLKIGRSDGSDCVHRFHIFDAQKHGDSNVFFKLSFATIHVKVTWSTLDVPNSALGEDNHYKLRPEETSQDDYDFDWNDY